MFGRDSDLKELIQQRTLELRASEARFHNIVSISTDGIVIVDGIGMILFVNPVAEFLFGRKLEKLLGEQFGFPIVAGETTELDIINKEGKPVIAEMRVVGTEWERKPAYLATLRDITDSKLAEKEVEKLNSDLAARADDLDAANKELEAFNYTVAHDLRQPLNVMSSYCQAIKMLCGDQIQDECMGYVARTYTTILRMDRLIGKLLDFSRLAKVEPRWDLVDLSALAHEVAGELKLTEPERQVDFLIANGITANADASLLRVVLDNLFGNAWKYTNIRDEAVIEFGTTEIDGKLAYFVRDNGPGFDQAHTPKLFVPFERLPGAEKNKGFGIGLATVERIILRHGGKAWAEGEPDKGATFYFTLSSG